MDTNPLVFVVAIALVDVDGRILIAQRPQGKSMAGYWEFPGGKVEEGELPEDALIREVREELGIGLSKNCLAPLTFASHCYEKFHLFMPLYVARRWTGQVRGRENQELKWVYPKELRKFQMPPADEPLVPHLIDMV